MLQVVCEWRRVMVSAWEFSKTRFVGRLEQWERFRDANRLHKVPVVAATPAERERWRMGNGRWFVTPLPMYAKDGTQVDSDGDWIAAEVCTQGTNVAIYRSPQAASVETLALIDPDAADALGRQLMRMAMVARARRAEEAIENNVDESMWQEGGG